MPKRKAPPKKTWNRPNWPLIKHDYVLGGYISVEARSEPLSWVVVGTIESEVYDFVCE